MKVVFLVFENSVSPFQNTELSMLIQNINWPQIQGSGDPNLIDVYVVAMKLLKQLQGSIPFENLDKGKGIQLVEVVETSLVHGQLIRYISVDELNERIEDIIAKIKKTDFLESYSEISILIISFLIWHGCINMSKCLRQTYVTNSGEEEYDLELRLKGYNYLCNFFSGNDDASRWIRYGVTISNELCKQRGDIIIDDWVPKDSPYSNMVESHN